MLSLRLADLVDEFLPSPPKSGIHVVGQGEASGFPSADRTSSHLEPGSELFVGDPIIERMDRNVAGLIASHTRETISTSASWERTVSASWAEARIAHRPAARTWRRPRTLHSLISSLSNPFSSTKNPYVDIYTSMHLAIPFHLVILKNRVEELLFYKLREAKKL